MTPKNLEIRVGVTVVLASLIVIVGIMWLQRFKLVEKRYSFFVKLPEVGGLTKDDPIMINGVEEGRVKAVQLAKQAVLVEMAVKQHVLFPKDSRITLRSVGIMGERFVSIKSGLSEEMVQPGDTLPGELEAGLSEVMGDAGRVLGELADATANLNEILGTVTKEGHLQSSMDNFHTVSERLKTVAGGKNSPLSKAIGRFESVSAMLDSLIGSRYAQLDSSMQYFSSAGRKMNDAMENLSKASSQLKELTEKLNAGEGSLGRLINDDALIQKLDSVVTDLNDLISDIKKHPGRYMTIRLF